MIRRKHQAKETVEPWQLSLLKVGVTCVFGLEAPLVVFRIDSLFWA